MSHAIAYHALSGRPLLHSGLFGSRLGESKTKGYVVKFVKGAAVACLTALPVFADTKPPLREVKEIDNELYYIAIANEISEYCPSISGRRFKAIGVMWGLRSKANKLGYSDGEIRAYVESDKEKARMRTKGEAYLARNGVTYENNETFCALGRKEIERNSAVGVYLKAN